MGGDVFVCVDVFGVLNLIAVDVRLGPVAAQYYVLRLAYVDSCIGGALGNRILDQQILAAYGVDVGGAVVFVGTACPFSAHPPHGDIVAILNGEGVPRGVFDSHIFNGKVVGLHQDSL